MSQRSIVVAVLLAFLLSFALVSGSKEAAAQSREQIVLERPVPGPVVPPEVYQRALANGTRTPSGHPGPDYWRLGLEYEIDAKLDPRTGLLTAVEDIFVENTSPDELTELVLHLHQNLHAPGVMRNRPQEITGGVTLHRVVAGGEELFEVGDAETAGYRVQGQLATLRPSKPIAPGERIALEVMWSFTVPQNSSGRMGHSNREIYFIAYWFPKVGVYDDMRGWDAQPYLGGSEFYDEYADYRVELTVPADWTVMATGQLQNAEEVFSEQTIERLLQAAESDEVVEVASVEDRETRVVTTHPDSGALTYRFIADEVRDFTWTASDKQVWNATSALVPDRDGDGEQDRVAIHSFWRPDRAPLWSEQAMHGKHAIEFLSRETKLAYPWPHMTSVEGADIIGGGMEFPMLTLIGDYNERGSDRLFGVTVHELAHMWTPMIIGSNEKRHAWMDEGFATFLTNQAIPEYYPEQDDPEMASRDSFLDTSRAEAEGAMMTHGDYYEVGYGTASYAKPATLLVTLRNLLGDEVFNGAIETYFQEWKFKHPAPWDFFSTLERAAGQDLDWFWSSWYYETWTLDQAVAEVTDGPDGPVVVIEDRGFAPMPSNIRVITSDAGVLEFNVPVTHWLSGATRYELQLSDSAGDVIEVHIDPDQLFPDIDRDNNDWPACGEC
jgi:hypothetical protein